MEVSAVRRDIEHGVHLGRDLLHRVPVRWCRHRPIGRGGRVGGTHPSTGHVVLLLSSRGRGHGTRCTSRACREEGAGSRGSTRLHRPRAVRGARTGRRIARRPSPTFTLSVGTRHGNRDVLRVVDRKFAPRDEPLVVDQAIGVAVADREGVVAHPVPPPRYRWCAVQYTRPVAVSPSMSTTCWCTSWRVPCRCAVLFSTTPGDRRRADGDDLPPLRG